MEDDRGKSEIIADARVMWCRSCGAWTVSDREPATECAACGSRYSVVRCARCGGTWQPNTRSHMPKLCFICKSSYWNRPYKDGTIRLRDDEPEPRMVPADAAGETALKRMMDAPLRGGRRAKGGAA